MSPAQIKDEEMYKALRREGASEEKAARISNAAAKTSRSEVGRKGGKAKDYDDMTKKQLLKRADEIGIKHVSHLKKKQLIAALRNH